MITLFLLIALNVFYKNMSFDLDQSQIFRSFIAFQGQMFKKWLKTSGKISIGILLFYLYLFYFYHKNKGNKTRKENAGKFGKFLPQCGKNYRSANLGKSPVENEKLAEMRKCRML